jgi:hypothetical protein
MRQIANVLIIALLCLFLFAAGSDAGVLETRYATLIYSNESQIREFNSSVSIGSRGGITMFDEAKSKVDAVTERVMMVLEMYVKNLKFRIVLLSSASEVRSVYRSKYNHDVNFISFYSPKDKTVYLSVDDANNRIFGHEVAHAVIDGYFKVPPSVKIHEMLAKYAESNLD